MSIKNLGRKHRQTIYPFPVMMEDVNECRECKLGCMTINDHLTVCIHKPEYRGIRYDRPTMESNS